MICAIGVRPEACATAYSLTLRSLLKTAELAAGGPLQTLLRSQRDPTGLDSFEIDRRRLTLFVSERYRSFPEPRQGSSTLAHLHHLHKRVQAVARPASAGARPTNDAGIVGRDGAART